MNDPIPTYSITKNFDWSETENNRLLFEMTAKYGTPYFSNYINSDMEPSDVRSMAILGTQNVIYRDKFGRISKNEIRHLVNNWINNPDRGYQMLMNGKFVDIIDMFKVDYKNYPTYVKINLANGQSQSFSYDHKCIVLRNGAKAEVLSQDVLPTDKFLLAKHGYDNDGIGTYDAGKIVGYYLAEGWTAHNDAQIGFAINIHRKDIASEIKAFFEALGSYVTVDEQTESNIFRINVYGRGNTAFISDFIEGKNAKEKRLRVTVFNTSLNFRKGIYDGYMQTDGSPNNKLFAHTTNKELCEDLIELGASIGQYFKYRVNPKNTRYFKPDKSDLTTFTSYELMPISMPEITVDGEDYYIIDVTGIEQLDASRINTVYNFTVDTKDHIYELPNGVITHQCCRLRLDLRELRKKSGGFFGSGESTGSIGVVTINLPRLSYLSKTEEEFWGKLDNLMDLAARSLKIKRDTITKLMDDGLYPYTKRYLGTLNNHFSTIGVLGGNEMCLNASWLRKDLTNRESVAFMVKVLNHMRERLSDYQELYGDLYNLEATPAESTTYRFAKHDKEQYPEIITANMNGTPYYTNSSHLPVGYSDDIFSALDVQDELQTLYTSGTVFHAFLGERLPTWQSAAALVRKIAENYKLPYYTMSPTYSVCQDHGYIPGEKFTCPYCGKKTEVYSRITGYYRPVQNWNDGKLQEFYDRRTYDIGHSNLHIKNDPVSNESNIAAPPAAQEESMIMLFATETCPNCKFAAALLDKEGIVFKKIIATEHIELANKYGIRQAPTLVVRGDKCDGDVCIYRGVAEIKEWLTQIK